MISVHHYYHLITNEIQYVFVKFGSFKSCLKCPAKVSQLKWSLYPAEDIPLPPHYQDAVGAGHLLLAEPLLLPIPLALPCLLPPTPLAAPWHWQLLPPPTPCSSPTSLPASHTPSMSATNFCWNGNNCAFCKWSLWPKENNFQSPVLVSQMLAQLKIQISWWLQQPFSYHFEPSL